MRKILLMLLCLVCLSAAQSSSNSGNCVLRFSERNITLHDFLSRFYACDGLGRSFVLDVSVEREFPSRINIAYNKSNYAQVLSDALKPLSLRLVQGKFIDVVVATKPETVSGFQNFSPSPGVGIVPSSSGVETSLSDSLLLDSLQRTLRKQYVSDSLAKANDYPVHLKLTMSLLSADTLRKYGISEPEKLLTASPKFPVSGFSIGKPYGLQLGNSYGLGINLYNDSLSDYQELSVAVYDTLGLLVGPRRRVATGSLSNGQVITQTMEQEQYGLQCRVSRKLDTLRYNCSYTRDADAGDFVQFNNSLRVGETQVLSYNILQWQSSERGGLFWFLPFLRDNRKERKRYVLLVSFGVERHSVSPAPLVGSGDTELSDTGLNEQAIKSAGSDL